MYPRGGGGFIAYSGTIIFILAMVHATQYFLSFKEATNQRITRSLIGLSKFMARHPTVPGIMGTRTVYAYGLARDVTKVADNTSVYLHTDHATIFTQIFLRQSTRIPMKKKKTEIKNTPMRRLRDENSEVIRRSPFVIHRNKCD